MYYLSLLSLFPKIAMIIAENTLRVLHTDIPCYRNFKGNVSVNVLVVCDQHMNFIFVLFGWEGSAADSRILCDVVTRPNELRVPNSCYYLCDGGYTNYNGFLDLYRDVRYHLKEWDDRRQPQNHQEYFNLKHSRARNCIEHSFGILKTSWGILRSNSYYPIKTQNCFILGCCLLHNFIRKHMATNSYEDEVTELVGDGIDAVEPTDGFIDQVESSQEWTTIRDNLAMQIKRVGATTSRVWTFVEECKLMNALKELVSKGHKCDNGFRSGYLLLLENMLSIKFPGSNLKGEPHINSKIHVWKRQYVCRKRIFGLSGVGLNSTMYHVEVLPEVWEAQIKLRPNRGCKPSAQLRVFLCHGHRSLLLHKFELLTFQA
ncbi:hypothetical protein ACS0TY_025050 [Phlomoides rotata]